MTQLFRRAALTLVFATLVLLAPTNHTSAEPSVHNFVFATNCESAGAKVSAWFLIPEASETLQRISEHGGPSQVPDEVWIDLSLSDDGFPSGTFIGAGPFPSPARGTASFIWHGLLPGTLHYYRLTARAGADWFPIGTGAFETPDCTTVSDTTCHAPPSTAASFLVPPAGLIDGTTGASQQWIDLSLFDNGFAPDSFVGAGPFSPSGASFLWVDLLPGRVHYYRVNTDYGVLGWKETAVGAFSSLDCNGLPNNISIPI